VVLELPLDRVRSLGGGPLNDYDDDDDDDVQDLKVLQLPLCPQFATRSFLNSNN